MLINKSNGRESYLIPDEINTIKDLKLILNFTPSDEDKAEVLKTVSLDKISDSIDSIYSLQSLFSLNCNDSIKTEVFNKVSLDKISDSITSIYSLQLVFSLKCSSSIKTEILNKLSLDKILSKINSINQLKDLLELNCDDSIKTEMLSKLSFNKISANIGSIAQLETLLELNCDDSIKISLLNNLYIDKIASSINCIDKLKYLLSLNLNNSINSAILNKLPVDEISNSISSIDGLNVLVHLDCNTSIKSEILKNFSLNKINSIIKDVTSLQSLFIMDIENSIKADLFSKLYPDEIASSMGNTNELDYILELNCTQKIKNKIIEIKNKSIDLEDMNLVDMILSLKDNKYDNWKKVTTLYDIYIDSPEMKYNNNFRASLKISKNCIQNRDVWKESISSLRINDPDSFVILPLNGIFGMDTLYSHLWSTLIRKTNDGYSAIIINKGPRAGHNAVEEFVFRAYNVQNLIHALHFCRGFKNISAVYNNFITQSDYKYNLKIRTSPQKVGNCFTKNIQAGIKLAQGLRDLSSDEFEKLRLPSYSRLETQDKDKVTFKWKGKTTEEVNKLVAEKVAANNPRIKNSVDESIEKYVHNKYFRKTANDKTNGLSM